MAKARQKIPDELATKVLYQSDRTCCICRLPGRKIEIHHIDGDPSNNKIDNLAVLCKDCHSEAHSTQAFARNLTPALVQKYNESWQDIVRVRLEPGGEKGLILEYRYQIMMELFMAVYRWRDRYENLWPDDHAKDFYEKGFQRSSDYWKKLSDYAPKEYSEEEWGRYLPLFNQANEDVSALLERIISVHSDGVPIAIKLAVIRLTSKLRTERIAYINLPRILQGPRVSGQGNYLFRSRFTESMDGLVAFIDQVERERQAAKPCALTNDTKSRVFP